MSKLVSKGVGGGERGSAKTKLPFGIGTLGFVYPTAF